MPSAIRVPRPTQPSTNFGVALPDETGRTLCRSLGWLLDIYGVAIPWGSHVIRRLGREWAGDSTCHFVRSFEFRGKGTWILRAV